MMPSWTTAFMTSGQTFRLPFPKDKKKLLELACGTGIQSVRFAKAGFDVTGLDLSEDMLEIARKRAEAAGEAIEFKQGNMLDLSQAGKYDLVTCYSDSICYMADEVEVGDVFKQVYDSLNDGGVFIFDVHSTYKTDTVFLATLTTKMRKSLPWSKGHVR